jgi:predicted RNA-binding Zn ribbon-like protein
VASRRQSAPDELAPIEHFVNGMRASTAQELAAWFDRTGEAPPRLQADDSDLAHALELRESLRALLTANNGVPADESTTRTVNEALRRCGVLPVVSQDAGTAVRYETSAEGVDAILGRYLCAMLTAIDGGSWARFKACANADCRWAFYDRSRNHAGTWCEMRTCGSMFKMRRHRARQRMAAEKRTLRPG